MSLPIVPRGPIDNEDHFKAFSRDVPTYSGPTPDRINPDVYVERDMYKDLLISLPDGKKIEVWGFEDDNSPLGKQFPSEMIRLREGQIFHGELHAHHGPHTIHWHGIEPTSWNDGVGKLSFEVTGNYTYQWKAAEAGTYFYHCHRNTVLHFEYGMYGLLIIDPPQGKGFVRIKNDVMPYDVEGFIVTDDMDPLWHLKDKDAGIGDYPFEEDDAGLNVFDPKYFFITGVPHPWTRTSPKCVINARVGQRILVRVLCAGYTYHKYTFGLDATVIAMDGRTLGRSGEPGAHCPYSKPFGLPAGTPFELTAARRWDLLIVPTEAGTYPINVEMRHISAGRPAVSGVAETFINVTD